MTRTCFPFVRYALNTPVPPADRPRLKKRACMEKRDESGNSLIAKGSSKDSYTSRGVKELSHSKGVLFQSNSIVWLIVNQTPMQCNDNVITSGVPGCQWNINVHQNKMATATVRWPLAICQRPITPRLSCRRKDHRVGQ